MEEHFDNEIRWLLELKGETKNIDFKEIFNWKTADKSDRCKIVKDILAFANTQDGGKIIFGVRDHDYFPVGLSDDNCNSFDQTTLHQLLGEYASPSFDCRVTKPIYEGKKLVVIDISEFEEIPIICKADIQDSKGKYILNRGAIYIRGNDASSRIIQSAEEMRDFLKRAVLKKKNDFLRDFQLILENKAVPPEKDKAIYDKIISEQIIHFDNHFKDYKGIPYWEVISYPVTYQNVRLAEISNMRELILNTQIKLRGLYFPYIQNHDDESFQLKFFNNGIEFNFKDSSFIEKTKLYQSGLFMWRSLLDSVSESNIKEKEIFYSSIIYSMVEYFNFIQRFYKQFLENSDEIYIRISLIGCTNYRLETPTPIRPIRRDLFCSENTIIPYDNNISLIKLETQFLVEAATALKKVFDMFNWNLEREFFINVGRDFLQKKYL